MEKSIVLFLHIPKSAGMTLRRILKRQYGWYANLTVDSNEFEEKFATLSERKKKRLQAVKGHFSFGIHKQIPRPSTYITLLRDPVERVISFYYYVSRNPGHYLYDKVRSQGISLDAFVSCELKTELENGQTRMLVRREDIALGADVTRDVSELAKKNLREHFTVVGPVESFDETLVLMKLAFDWSMPFYTRENVTRKRTLKESVSSMTLNVIRERNKYDIEMHAYAKELLKKQIEREGERFEQEFKRFKFYNHIYQVCSPNTYFDMMAPFYKVGRFVLKRK